MDKNKIVRYLFNVRINENSTSNANANAKQKQMETKLTQNLLK